MNGQKFTLIVLVAVAAMAKVESGLVIIPIHNAAALLERGTNVSTSINGVHISARGINIDTGQSRAVAR
ncbi:MAG TPA: hypothetical protein VJ729_17335 [Nitrososphaeraceae archaeon]|nr:hypothetical protein [Nitrososphaeraceae archaeon]